ncbi:hypothetical protein ACQE3E_07200 [Methylomonas sp. MED-D]|uniref:hypothetical protein n=1 Tax=unclassified Methylomonas TaxID=2608980 RepID=UPI00143B0BE4|nr:hypothetical protein [Methylomonas sp. MV1]MDT4329303.1 hypothetical protein [Methylomonas sp. MV1]NJA04203.1 hypothetical protein [Methylococcaceae bacterium WWC4]
MKRTFGNLFERLLGGGTTLTEVEFQLLQHLVGALPLQLRSVVDAQFSAYNLVQRESDGRALNFYRKKAGRANNMDGLPLLQMSVDEAPLIRLTATLAGDAEPLHATLNAVGGRVFCMALSRAVRAEGAVTVSDFKQAWRSNFRYETAAA